MAWTRSNFRLYLDMIPGELVTLAYRVLFIFCRTARDCIYLKSSQAANIVNIIAIEVVLIADKITTTAYAQKVVILIYKVNDAPKRHASD